MFLSSKKVSSLKGHIDVFDAGIVHGWIYDFDQSLKPASFFIAYDGNIICRDQAQKYRADLKDAGYGSGHCAFSKVIDISKADSGVHQISLLDVQHKLIHQIEVELPENDDAPFVELISSENGALEFLYKQQNIPENIEVHLYENDDVIWMGKVELNLIDERFYLPVPDFINDGREHTLSIGVRGFPRLVWSGVVLMLLPTFSKNNISGLLANQSDDGQGSRHSQRYKSLSRQVQHSKDVSHLSKVYEAHKHMLDGCNSNVDLPKFVMSSNSNKRVSIYVLLNNNLKDAFHLVASFILAYEPIGFEITFIANSSTVKELNQLDRLNGIVLVERTAQQPLGDLISQLAMQQNNDFILLCNGLHEASSDLISVLVNRLNSDELAGVLGARLLSDDGCIWESGLQINDDGKLDVLGYGKSWLDPKMAVSMDCVSFLDAPVCIRTHDLIECSDRMLEIDNLDEYIYFLCTYIKETGKSIQTAPQAEGFAFPNVKSVGNQKIKRIEFIRDLHKSRLLKESENKNIAQPKKRILMFDMTTPTPDRDAGSYAAIQEMKLILALGFNITFVPVDLQYKIKYTAQIQELGVEVLYRPFFRQVGDVILREMPNVSGIYVTRYNVAAQFMHILKRTFPDVPIIFNNADLHFLREIRSALTMNNPKGLETALTTRHNELEVINQVDAVLSYTETEKAVITSHLLENKKLFKCPWVLEKKHQVHTFSERNGIAFLGGFKHLPNVQAVDYFVNQVMPLLVVKAPHIKLQIFGSNMPDRFFDYQSDNIEIIGFIENLEDIFHHCRIFIAPLLAGAGIKGKVLESLSYGVPCVLSSISAEGTGLTHGLTTMIADSPDEWVESITTLYNDERQWNQISKNQNILVESEYSFEHGKKMMKRILDSVGLI